MTGDALMRRAIVMHHKDNVATVIRDTGIYEVVRIKVGGKEKLVKVRQAIPFGHKLSIRRIEEGEKVIKYGEVIGKATRTIEEGEHVHVHNVESTRGK